MFLGYSCCFFSNGILAYQSAIYSENSKAYIEREQFLASRLPEHHERDKKRGFKKKVEESAADLEDELSVNLRGTSSDFFDHGPMM